ncbi:MAG: TolC family protein [Agitococcus sp.]|nr:TolC family protein [Agitococcus sp.]
MINRYSYFRLSASVLSVLMLAGCATPSAQDGFSSVAEMAKSRLAGKETRWLQSDKERQELRHIINAKLSQPLTIDDAVQIALLNNRGLQAKYAQLGIAVSDLQAVSRLPDITLSFAHLREGNSLAIDRAISFDLLTLLTRPAARRLEQQNLQQVRLHVMTEMLSLATATRRAWIEVVAAKELEATAKQTNQTAQVARDVVERLLQVGNLSRLDLLREQALYADTQAELANAQQQVILRQAQLTVFLGLWGEESQYSLPSNLASLPDNPRADNATESTALQQRLDVLAANQASQRLAQSLGMTRTNRFIDVLDLGYQRNSVSGQATQKGYDISVRVPLFTGGTRQAKAQFLYQQSLDQAADTAIRARAEVRASYASYRLAYDTSRHYQQQVLPVRAQIAEEIMLRYNGMLLSVLDVIANARDQAQAQRAAIAAKRNFWLADSTLEAAMNGSSSSSLITMPE